jgi:curved DNA-binding protein
MFGGQNFHDFAHSHGGDFDLDEILRQIFGQGGGFGGFNTHSGFSHGFDSGFNFGQNLDIRAKIRVPFEVAALGGTQQISIGGDSLKIKIPAGIDNAEVLRVKGRGKKMQGISGDLMLEIEIIPHAEYKRDKNNITKDIQLDLKTAIFGGKVKVKTLEKEVTLKIPEGTKCGQKFRLKGLGIVDRKTKVKGDFFVKTNVLIPKPQEIDPELKEMIGK